MQNALTEFFGYFGEIHPHLAIRSPSVLPFKKHDQFPAMIDCLSRKYAHHLLLASSFSYQFRHVFLEAFQAALQESPVPSYLHEAPVYWLEVSEKSFTKIEQKTLTTRFNQLLTLLDQAEKCILLVLPNKIPLMDDKSLLQNYFAILANHIKCRIIVWDDAHAIAPHHSFTTIKLADANTADIHAWLNIERDILAHYHQIGIADDVVKKAYLLASRFLAARYPEEKALQLLDSAAARAQAAHLQVETKVDLNSDTLLQVLSSWTNIPPSHLHLHQFNEQTFTQGMQNNIFGQDQAISLLSSALLKSHQHIQQKGELFNCFLFAGPAHSGKKTIAIAIAQQLFKQLQLIYFIYPVAEAAERVSEIKFQRYTDRQVFTLKEIVEQTPHGMIVLDNVEQLQTSVRNQLQELLSTGMLSDSHGACYNLNQNIFIFTTTIGDAKLKNLALRYEQQTAREDLDFMQLIMREEENTISNLVPEELVSLLIPELRQVFSSSFLSHCTIVPFIPLMLSAVQKIVRAKLRMHAQQLQTQYGVELGFATEVVDFLAKIAIGTQDAMDTNKALQLLQRTIEQALRTSNAYKSDANQLFLMLNETGQILRYDWVPLSTIRQHSS